MVDPNVICVLWVSVTQLCQTLCNLMEYSLPSPSVHGILQARIVEWAAIPISRGSSQPSLLHWKQILYHPNQGNLIGVFMRTGNLNTKEKHQGCAFPKKDNNVKRQQEKSPRCKLRRKSK